MILSKRSVVLTLFSILVLSTASIGMVSYMPRYLLFYGTEKSIIQLIMTIFPLTLFVFPPILGKISDKIQNRIFFVIIGAFGVTISFILLIFTKNIFLVVLLSLIYGFFGASYRTIFTLYSELVQNNQKYISIYNALSTGGWFLGSQLGGIFIDIYTVENIFLFLSIISLFNLVLVIFIKENRSLIMDHYQKNTTEVSIELREEKKISNSIYYGLFFRSFGLKPIITVLSIIMPYYLSSDTQIGFLIGLNFLIQVALMLLMGYVITEKNDKFILIFGYLFSAIAALGYIIASDFFGFLLAQIFVAFSYSMLWSASIFLIAQNSTPLNKGTYMGYANTSSFLGSFLGGLFFSLLLLIFSFSENDYDIAISFMIIFPILAAITILLKFKPNQRFSKNFNSKKYLGSELGH
ncbi:MAG: MFS transporter [Candidatus Hermodarchaeota archaeon]